MASNHKQGIDTLLTFHGKSLQIGEEIRFSLVKGPSFPLAADPVNPKAPTEQFPLVAKFGDSVVKPDLVKAPWSSARLYQQDIPKAQDDSDEEVTTQEKKRWRPRRKEQPKRQWILQEEVEFLETMMAKRQKHEIPQGQTSTRYEGIPEHNPSQYMLLEPVGDGSTNLKVTLLPTPHATVTFSQPKVRKTLSMSEAEQAIADQRGKMTRFMMHDKQRFLNSEQGTLQSASRKRLLSKLAQVAAGDDDEEDDIMGDLAFRNRKGGGRARKELLDSLGDSTLQVDADGVIGGTNDSEFGKGQRFGQFSAEQQKKNANHAEDRPPESATQGNDGLAMADDFYQRDVQAEYEELDYDANEQFDDDDVDVGETEVKDEGSGSGAEDEEEEDLDEDDVGDRPSGAEGLASVAGFRLLLAKARGEITHEQATEAAEGAAKLKEKQKEELDRRAEDSKKRKRNEEDDHLAQIMAAAEKSREEADRKNKEAAAAAAADRPQAKQAKLEDSTGVQVDENGQRVITLKAVQKEIWLRHGRTSMKRLLKIFDIKRKTSPERQSKFREIIKELCTMENDPVEGRMLVLKQHYSAMG